MYILVSGDSWSLGEWSEGSLTLQHGGLAQYLSDDGHNVVNLGLSASSNRESLLRVTNFLSSNPHLSACKKQLVIFQTEWTRDFPYMDKEDQDYYDQPLTLMHRVISRFYYDLSALAQRFDLDIKVIGGASDTLMLDDFTTIYPRVEIVCQSLVNLLINKSHVISNPVFSLFSYSNRADEFLKLFKYHARDLEELMNEIDRGQQRVTDLKEHPEHFYPDGVHPNRSAHKILYDYLKGKYFQ